MGKVYALILTYDINFRDADEGDSYAGSNKEIINLYDNKDVPIKIAEEYNPVFIRAGEERTICPLGEANRIIRRKFGITVFDFDDGYNFKLYVKEFDIKSGHEENINGD